MPIEVASPVAPSTTRRGGMFRALSNPNYRTFWIGAFLSNVGTWMQAVAQGWLVLELTDSPFWLGLDAFVAMSPGFMFTLIGGVFADLVDRRRLMLFTQVVAGVAALGLAIMVATNLVNRWMGLGFSFVTGCCMALASPSFLAMTYDLVGREDLANAIAMNSTQFQLSRVVGPSLAGLAFRFLGLAGCFFANAFSFVAVVVALMMVRPVTHPHAAAHSVRDRRALWRDVQEVELSVAICLPRIGPVGIDAGKARRADPRRTRAAQLIMHQRDQRRHDNDATIQRDRGKLIGQRLSRPGRHHRERARARHHAIDDLALTPAKGIETECGFEEREESAGGH